jgi:hypothetical protein
LLDRLGDPRHTALTDAFVRAIHRFIGVAENLPREPTPQADLWETVEPLFDASRDAQVAYEALRDQMQRELRG